MKPLVVILGEYSPMFKPHAATDAAIAHACKRLSLSINSKWVSTEDISRPLLETVSGIWVAPGSPYKNMDKTLEAIRYARENHVPCLGTCGGFQHIILEYARNVLCYKDAQSQENDPYASQLFISQLVCSLAGRTMRLKFQKGSQISRIYSSLSAEEEYYCNFGVNPEYVSTLTSSSLSIVGSDDEGEVRVIEIPTHPFFVGTLFVPQTRSKPDMPHPVVTAFLKAAVQQASL
ncbi:MAG: CTP synthase [Cyanobacteria bacterium J06627_32]